MIDNFQPRTRTSPRAHLVPDINTSQTGQQYIALDLEPLLASLEISERGNIKYECATGKGVVPEARENLGLLNIPAVDRALDAFPVTGSPALGKPPSASPNYRIRNRDKDITARILEVSCATVSLGVFSS